MEIAAIILALVLAGIITAFGISQSRRRKPKAH